MISLSLLTVTLILFSQNIRTTLFFLAIDFLLICTSIIVFIISPYKRFQEHVNNYIYGYDKNIFLPNMIMPSSQLKELFQKIDNDLRTETALSSSNKHSEYRALQNQINPHFLYNTLEGIRSDLLGEGSLHTASIIEALATYFRYTISNVDTFVTLEDELTNLQTYLTIQNYRFGDRIKWVEEFEECDRSIFQNYIPKLILQPFVENAIIHGLEEKVGKGIIKICYSRTEKLLLITLEDNGIGIEEEKLNQINATLNSVTKMSSAEASKGGIAIKNVNNRIKLLFGERYGVKLRSIQGFGTSVDIVLPLIDRTGLKEKR
jgi:two-component system, sensor histidine kinase YesM